MTIPEAVVLLLLQNYKLIHFKTVLPVNTLIWVAERKQGFFLSPWFTSASPRVPVIVR